MAWLLAQAVCDAIQAAQTQHAPGEITASGDITTVSNRVATIQVKGVMTQQQSWYAQIFGGGNTTYPQIIDALGAAGGDERVDSIVLEMDSPGGSVDGLFDAMEALANVGKPSRVEVSNQAASAAYMLAAQADTIVATNPVARFGSVGVVVDSYVSEEKVSVTSTDAPNKRHDLKTEAGRATLRAELDDIHEIMVSEIAKGRGTTVETVNAKYGRGGMLVASKAVEAGMIDSLENNAVPSRGGPLNAIEEGSNMDLKTLKAQHPETFAKAREEGITAERDRVGAHLTMGHASGDMATAVAACKDGTGMTATLQATYMAAGMNKNDSAARETESVGDLGAGGTEETAKSIEDQVADAMAADEDEGIANV